MTDAARDLDDDAEQAASKHTDPNWSISKVVAVVLGAPLVAFAVGVVCIAKLPVDQEHAFAWGLHLMVPTWFVLASVLPLARHGRVALGACLGAGAVCGALLWLGGGG